MCSIHIDRLVTQSIAIQVSTDTARLASSWYSIYLSRRSRPIRSLLSRIEYWPFSRILPVDNRCGPSSTYHITTPFPLGEVSLMVMPTSKYHSRMLSHPWLRRRISRFSQLANTSLTSLGLLRAHCLLLGTTLEDLIPLVIPLYLMMFVNRNLKFDFRWIESLSLVAAWAGHSKMWCRHNGELSWEHLH